MQWRRDCRTVALSPGVPATLAGDISGALRRSPFLASKKRSPSPSSRVFPLERDKCAGRMIRIWAICAGLARDFAEMGCRGAMRGGSSAGACGPTPPLIPPRQGEGETTESPANSMYLPPRGAPLRPPCGEGLRVGGRSVPVMRHARSLLRPARRHHRAK